MLSKRIVFFIAPMLLMMTFAYTSKAAAATPSRIYLPLITGINASGPASLPVDQPAEPTAAPVTPPAAPTTPGTPSFADEVLALTNVERAAAGCPALAANPQLATAAQTQTVYMATTETLSHTGANGSLPWDRMQAAGYLWSRAAENIAEGYETPADVVQGWMNSSAHRANILNCGLRDLGVGYATASDGTKYWTQDFGTPR